MIVKVNGIQYQSVDEPKCKPMSRFMAAALMMGGVYGISSSKPTKCGPDASSIDYIKEYELIKNKQSKLSRAQRDYVVRYFEKHFKPIEP